jgi:zinc protease
MSLRRLLLALFLALTPATGFAQPGRPAAGATPWLYRGSDLPPNPAWRFGTLPNGLRYAVRRNGHPEHQVSIRVRIDVGSLNERPEELGWAHVIEHMMFRGSARFADREARHIWQELGANFGSDTNAFTSLTQTFYQLDLPNADRTRLDRSLDVMADMMTTARFDPAAVDAERQIVMAEKERRPEMSVRFGDEARRLFQHGLLSSDRDTIGTDATLRAAAADGLRALYRRWYRPERATIIIVGDADPDVMVELITARFGGWRGEGPRPAEPDPGRLAPPPSRVASLVYGGAPFSAATAWVRPHRDRPDTRAVEQQQLEDLIAATIINRRLERHARGDSAFIAATIGVSDHRGTAEMTQLSVAPKNGRWQDALREAFAVVADARRAPPQQAEIDREIANFRTLIQTLVESEPTALSQTLASQMVTAVDERDVMLSPAARRDLFASLAPQMTPGRIAAATQRLFTGSPPRLLVLSPTELPGGAHSIELALAAAEQAAPLERGAERTVSFDDLPVPGTPGREVGRERIEDLDVTIVRFANGSTLTFKPTHFEQGRVYVQLRFGRGVAGLDPARPSLGWASSFVGPSGIAGLDLDAIERLLTGRRMSLAFGVDENAFVLTGATSQEDLGDQLRLLTAKLTAPRWDPALFRRFQNGALQSYDLQFSTASGRGGRELAALLHPGDQRWRPVGRDEMIATTPDALESFFAPRLAQGPVHAVIVGDTTLERAIEAVRGTVGGLPTRPEPAIVADPAAVRPPAPNPEPVRFTHNGDPAQAFAVIGWSTLGGTAHLQERRALALAGNILQTRLFDRLREEEGASYSPNAAHVSSEIFPNWGVFYAAAELRPERVPVFLRIARETIADLAAHAVAADEFARAQNPVVSGIERRVETNGYWLEAVEDFATDPSEIPPVRSYLADYRGLTPEDVRRAIAAYVADQGDWSMVVLPARAAPATAAAGGAASAPGAGATPAPGAAPRP